MRQCLFRWGRTAVVVPGIAVALALTGCKDDQGGAAVAPRDQASPSGTHASPAPPGRTPAPARTRLTVTVRMSSAAKPVTRTLTCDPVGGDLPRPADACAVLARAAAAGTDPFAPTPKDQMCTQIYGGPQTATIKGTWNGRPVDATFDRKNGCETKRWNDLAALLGSIPVGH
jgi:Subtilisin inhibitor-like